MRELHPNTSREGDFPGMVWGSVWGQSLLPGCQLGVWMAQVITGAEKKIGRGCEKMWKFVTVGTGGARRFKGSSSLFSKMSLIRGLGSCLVF